MGNEIRIEDYDCIGFDLDHTLLRYNITNLVRMEYECLSEFLVKQRGYDPEYLYKPLTGDAIDFMQKGLILDLDKGNILKISADGTILLASHGTKMLTTRQIEETYTNNGQWEALKLLTNDPVAVWNGPVSLKLRALLDYFDMPFALVFARAVDALDAKNSIPHYDIWPDICAAAVDMYDRGQFKKDAGNFFPQLKKNPEKYLHKCSQNTINWLKLLRNKKNNRKLTFLITGSNADFTNFTATYAMGSDWKSLFDVIVCFAKKPGFFTESRPFWSVSGETHQEVEKISDTKIVQGGMYSQGNWNGLKEFLSRTCNNPSPKCLYIGDNLIQDIYVPSKFCGLDTVVINEEYHAEILSPLDLHPDRAYLVSDNNWGSYFYLPNHSLTHWSNYIKRYARICIPSIDFIAGFPVDHVFEAFDEASGINDSITANTKANGFHPHHSSHV
uniref:5'-nucleotidase domain-containing protein 1 n=1 Tax=Bracon brevicornis TaxID=1563983 RepID=A0A6V7M5V7_9HYME